MRCNQQATKTYLAPVSRNGAPTTEVTSCTVDHQQKSADQQFLNLVRPCLKTRAQGKKAWMLGLCQKISPNPTVTKSALTSM